MLEFGCYTKLGWALLTMNFMDRNGGVNDLGLNGFLVDYWLDGFVDVLIQFLVTCVL